jgi:hypothetical protein
VLETQAARPAGATAATPEATMADEAATDARRPMPLPEDVKKQYIGILMSILQDHAAASGDARKALQAITADPQKAFQLDGGLLDLIKLLCDCKAVIAILECLCKMLTGG